MKKEKAKKEVKEIKTQKALVTSRILFISVLDKIYLILLGLWFLIGTITIFRGHISSLNYGFFGRVGREILFLIVLFIVYLILNWFYRCASKTMLCLTKNEVYKEHYIPFKRSEDSIPLNKITKVTTINVFWIFRTLIIHQYHSFPLVFMTWNNQEFKDKLNELITTDSEKVENEYESRNIITKEMYKWLSYIGMALAGIIVLLGIIRFFTYMFSGERKIAGVYTYENNKVTLNKNGSCEIIGLVDHVTDCSWNYDKHDKEITLLYEYYYTSYYGRTISNSGTKTFSYDSNDKSLLVNGDKYTK